MQTTIFCKTVAKGKQSFYVSSNRKVYFLFQQAYRVSNKEYFQSGVSINDISKFSGVHSTAVRKTLDKLPIYIKYIEKEYGIAIYDKTKVMQSRSKYKEYKRQRMLYQDIENKVA